MFRLILLLACHDIIGTVPMLPLETVNKGKRIFIGCFRAEYSVQTGYCPSTFIATFNNFTSQWEYPSTSGIFNPE